MQIDCEEICILILMNRFNIASQLNDRNLIEWKTNWFNVINNQEYV